MTEKTKMQRFLVESPHEAEECARIVGDVRAMGYLHHFDWGCKSGVHVGWAMVEVENEGQARLLVPPLVRQRARVIRVDKWFAEDFEK